MTDIYLAPVKAANTTLLNNIKTKLQELLKTGVHIIDLPVDIDSSLSPDRNQYHSTKIIADSIPLTSVYDGKIVVITDYDLFVPVFTFVYGEAQLNGKHSVVSLCRLHEEFYTGESNDSLLLQRAIKEILHELGHNFGLLHCKDWDCVMHTSNIIEEVDIKGKFYCSKCYQAII